MNITEAKKIPLEKIVEKLGGRYSHTDRRGDLWYFSPFRPDEKTASFKVNIDRNTWHDFGLSNTYAHRKQQSGGDVLDLWCEYHSLDRRSGIKEALLHLACEHRFDKDYLRQPVKLTQRNKASDAPRFVILNKANKIKHDGLKQELGRRRISLQLANLYLVEGKIQDTVTKKIYHGFLFENDKGGYEVSIPNPDKNTCFKTCIGPKASSRVLVDDDRNSADVFEGFWDFLSWLQMKAVLKPINHSYILNSTSLVGEACDKITAYNDVIKYAFLFMDNDEAGYQATHAIAAMLEDSNIKVGSMEQFYDGYKDLNDFRMNYKPM